MIYLEIALSRELIAPFLEVGIIWLQSPHFRMLYLFVRCGAGKTVSTRDFPLV